MVPGLAMAPGRRCLAKCSDDEGKQAYSIGSQAARSPNDNHCC